MDQEQVKARRQEEAVVRREFEVSRLSAESLSRSYEAIVPIKRRVCGAPPAHRIADSNVRVEVEGA